MNLKSAVEELYSHHWDLDKMGDHHTAGTLVWVNDPQDGWIKGEVLKMEDKKLKVRTEKGAVGLYIPEDCPLQNPMSRMGVEVRLSDCRCLLLHIVVQF